MRKTAAFVEGSRADVIVQGKPISYTISQDPTVVLEKRQHVSDSKYMERVINYKIVEDYDPINIYEFKVLPADERPIKKFNSATF